VRVAEAECTPEVLKEKTPKSMVVKFCGDGNFGWVENPAKCVVPFRKLFDQKARSSSTIKFRDALREAIEEESDLFELREEREPARPFVRPATKPKKKVIEKPVETPKSAKKNINNRIFS